MARLMIRKGSSFLDRIWSVDQAVGQGCPNKRDDVLLVQFLLRVIMADSPNSKGFVPPGQPPIAIDGIYGTQTQKYIKFFEEEDNRRNPNNGLFLDGRIDPMVSGGVTGANSGLLYKIAALNVHYKQRRGQVHLDISLDPLFPAELKKSFFV